jgi:hypothetical protein
MTGDARLHYEHTRDHEGRRGQSARVVLATFLLLSSPILHREGMAWCGVWSICAEVFGLAIGVLQFLRIRSYFGIRKGSLAFTLHVLRPHRVLYYMTSALLAEP